MQLQILRKHSSMFTIRSAMPAVSVLPPSNLRFNTVQSEWQGNICARSCWRHRFLVLPPQWNPLPLFQPSLIEMTGGGELLRGSVKRPLCLSYLHLPGVRVLIGWLQYKHRHLSSGPNSCSSQTDQLIGPLAALLKVLAGQWQLLKPKRVTAKSIQRSS